ncbi:hypothetical protein FV226_24510 [Methylobacterium sp. WL12]|uniref:hypothetical protein n=1 Tax=Methylobacterium sp. WL12 TaxID=2603890 RepID=UPI0011CB115E|nr:hypothetical protein [Methylobacterium sp. WL12]TXM65779.1 hypothetical protein FV226_24510 [Methylobacterium sp. WL12]
MARRPQAQAATQPTFDLPLDKEAIKAIVRAHVTAWLTNDRGETLPSLVSEFVRVRQWGPDEFAARVRLFDGATATIYVVGAPAKRNGVMPKIRHDGRDFFFHGGDWAWQRFLPGETRDMVAKRVGHNFY